jgi:hypothetical protein
MLKRWGLRVIDKVMWVFHNVINPPSPSHHEFMWYIFSPFQVMDGKHGIVFTTFLAINSD